MLKLNVILSCILLGSIANAASQTTFVVNGRQATKLEALISLAKDKNADVMKCQPQELSDKATLKAKKASRKQS